MGTETLFDPPRPAGRGAFTVAGEPQPQGSKSPFPIYKGGPCGTCKRRELATINLTEAVKGLRPWRREVARAAAAAMGGQPPLAGPLLVHATFTMRKPATAPRRRRTWPKARPDVDKLLRAVLDGMTLGGTYTDDGQVVVALAAKCYPGEPSSGLPWERPLDAPGVHITIERLAWLPGETP